MWYPTSVQMPPAYEPVSREQVKQQSRISFTKDDDLLDRLIAAARSHVEKYCGLRLMTQTVVMKCDGFADFCWLPEAPIQSISSIAYVDAAGASQTLSTDLYELRADDLQAAIVLKFGQVWPAIQPGSRITVTAVAGFTDVPAAIMHAMLLLIGAWYECREETVIGVGSSSLPASVSFDALLSNFRRGV